MRRIPGTTSTQTVSGSRRSQRRRPAASTTRSCFSSTSLTTCATSRLGPINAGRAEALLTGREMCLSIRSPEGPDRTTERPNACGSREEAHAAPMSQLRKSSSVVRQLLKRQGAKAADNGGCAPPQFPSIKAQSLQQLRCRDLTDTI